MEVTVLSKYDMGRERGTIGPDKLSVCPKKKSLTLLPKAKGRVRAREAIGKDVRVSPIQNIMRAIEFDAIIFVDRCEWIRRLRCCHGTDKWMCYKARIRFTPPHAVTTRKLRSRSPLTNW
jgi:hypothetical protein